MAVSRQLILNCKSAANEDITTTISNINPDDAVTKVMLKTAAQKLNSLTNNTLVSIYVVNTEDITSASE